MNYYVFKADNAADFIDELITCNECVFFHKHVTEFGSAMICTHPKGMVRPLPDGFCYYADEKPIYEREAEND